MGIGVEDHIMHCPLFYQYASDYLGGGEVLRAEHLALAWAVHWADSWRGL